MAAHSFYYVCVADELIPAGRVKKIGKGDICTFYYVFIISNTALSYYTIQIYMKHPLPLSKKNKGKIHNITHSPKNFRCGILQYLVPQRATRKFWTVPYTLSFRHQSLFSLYLCESTLTLTSQNYLPICGFSLRPFGVFSHLVLYIFRLFL